MTDHTIDPGKHIKWKLTGVPFERLADVRLIGSMLLDAVHAVEMRPLDHAHVYNIREALQKQGLDPDPDEPEGISGIVVLSTSHAAVHTWPHRNYAYFDLFSCRDFDPEKVEEIFARYLEPPNMNRWDFSYSLRLESETPLRKASRKALAAVERWGGRGNATAKELRHVLDGPGNGKMHQ